MLNLSTILDAIMMNDRIGLGSLDRNSSIRQPMLASSMAYSKEDVLSIYNKLKSENGGVPLRIRDFYNRSEINKHILEAVFGANPYTKLQQLAGDAPNILNLTRTSRERIMRDYAGLASETIDNEGRLPVAAHWKGKQLSPTPGGLSRTHGIKWSDFPEHFLKFCSENAPLRQEYNHVVEFIEKTRVVERSARESPGANFLNTLVSIVRTWSPALRRNSEEAYKSELAQYLKQHSSVKTSGKDVREEKSDSRCDIAIGSDIGIEIKKNPSLFEYDRCFGQVARHLKSYNSVIVLICDVPRRDQFEDFCQLVDKYFGDAVRVLKNG